MPEGFDFPPGVAAWIPRELPGNASRTAHNWRGLGRVRDGVTVAQARANLSAIARRIKDQYGKDVDLSDAAVVPLADAMVGDVRTALLTLLGAVGLLLLVACANVAGLLLARTSARSKELAVRVALGAGRGRLIQQFLAESFSLSLAGGVFGILMAAWAVRVLPAILPANLPRQQGVAINTPVLLFALAAIVAVAVSLGLFAAWRAAGGDLQEALTSGSRSYTGTGSSQRFRGFLVIGEIAATLVILIGAGLLGRSFLRLIATSPGFSPQNLITMEFSLPTPKGNDDGSVGHDAPGPSRGRHIDPGSRNSRRGKRGLGRRDARRRGRRSRRRRVPDPQRPKAARQISRNGRILLRILPKPGMPFIASPARRTSAPWAFR